MTKQISITLSDDLVEELDRVCGGESRSAFIEEVLRSYLRRRARDEADARDLELINAAADYLNEEAMDVLEYQVLPDEGA